jgi:hypothetical protein
LDEGELLRAAVVDALGAPGDTVPTIVLEGVNRSAIELFEDVLTEISVGFRVSAADSPRPTVMFGSLLEGPAALPLDPNYLQIGPIFDLDYLDWRSRAPDGAELATGKLGLPQFRSINVSSSKGVVDEDEPLRLLRKVGLKRNPRLERSVLAAYRSLSRFKRSASDLTALQSLAYGWLMPLWLLHGLSREAIDAELDRGKLDGTTADRRLSDMLDAMHLIPGNLGETA